MRGRVPDDLERLRVLLRDDRHFGVFIDHERGVDELSLTRPAIAAGQTRADARGDFGRRSRFSKVFLAAVWQRNDRHRAKKSAG